MWFAWVMLATGLILSAGWLLWDAITDHEPSEDEWEAIQALRRLLP